MTSPFGGIVPVGIGGIAGVASTAATTGTTGTQATQGDGGFAAVLAASFDRLQGTQSAADSLATLLETTWTLTPVADRIGFRYSGGELEWRPREQPFGAGSDPSTRADHGTVAPPAGPSTTTWTGATPVSALTAPTRATWSSARS